MNHPNLEILKTVPYLITDMDGVLVDIISKHLMKLYSLGLGTEIIKEKKLITTWKYEDSYNTEQWLGLSRDECWDDLKNDEEFYDNLPPSYLLELYKPSIEAGKLAVFTKSWKYSPSYKSKMKWLDRWLPGSSHIVTPCEEPKLPYFSNAYFPDGTPLENFEVYIEDSAKELLNAKNQFGERCYLLVEYGHNKNANQDLLRIPCII